MVKDTGDKLGDADKATVESAITSLKAAIESNDLAAMTSGMEALTQAQHKVAEALYKQAGAAGSAPSSEPAGGDSGTSAEGAGDVIDAEVVEDEKK
jgi:molecular chaperone DnaK